MPIVRKVSLQRFLAMRKNRITTDSVAATEPASTSTSKILMLMACLASL
jgi:hypothetical protein